MALKPYRQYSDNDVLTQFSLTEDSGNAGSAVRLVSWDPDVQDPSLSNLSPWAGQVAGLFTNPNKVILTSETGTYRCQLAGLILMDVRATSPLGFPYNMDPQRSQRHGIAYSGESIAILKKGVVESNWIENAESAGPGSGLICAPSGKLRVVNGVDPSSYDQKIVAKCLSSSGSDGYVIVDVDFYGG